MVVVAGALLRPSSRSARRRCSGRGRAAGSAARPCRGRRSCARATRRRRSPRRARGARAGRGRGRAAAPGEPREPSGLTRTTEAGGIRVPDHVSHTVAEAEHRAQGRRRVGDRDVAAVDELGDAEGLDAELERAPPVRRGVEVDVVVEGRADVHPARREPLELERRAAGEDREDDGKRRPALLPVREPVHVRGLHLRRVDGDRRPPRRPALDRAARRVDEEKGAAAAELVEERRERIEVGERRRADRRADEAVEAPAGGEGREPPARRRDELPRAVLPDLDERMRARPAAGGRARSSSGARRRRAPCRRDRARRAGGRARARAGRARTRPRRAPPSSRAGRAARSARRAPR